MSADGQSDFRGLVDRLHLAVAGFDGMATCTYLNPAMAVAIAGDMPLFGRSLRDAWPHCPDMAFLDARLREVLARGQPAEYGATFDQRMPGRHRVRFLPITDAGGGITGVFMVSEDISAATQAELVQRRLNRALRMLSACNQSLLHAQDEASLLKVLCSLIVDVGGYRMSWVGMAQQDSEKRVVPINIAGTDTEYLHDVKITWDEAPTGKGPTGTAIRTGKTAVNCDFLNNPAVAVWRDLAIQKGFRSSIALPLRIDDATFGALTIYAAEPDAFNQDEVKLLEEMADDLSFGLTTLRNRQRRQQAEARLAFLAGHDPLTGLPNRVMLRDSFDACVASARADNTKIALLFLDLDNFKHVNDNFNHAVGDRLLTILSERLCRQTRERDVVSRQGGDEFVILQTGITDTDSVATLAHRVLNSIALPVTIDDHTFVISFSIGISLYPDDGEDFETLLKRADAALYHAKDRGRANFSFYSSSLNRDAAERWKLHASLRRGLDDGEFLVHYQPQVEIESGRIIGAEALVRWQQPGDSHLTPPGLFIPAAEQSGMIVQLGEFVLEQACAQAAAWRRQRFGAFSIAVNLSAIQFRRGDIASTVVDVLDRHCLPPDCLELELTESLLLEDTETVIRTLASLKALGVQFSIDDFGTGYSSLAYLKRLNVDKLKIDQSFVRDIAVDNDCAIVNAIIQLGRTLDLTVVAEGVETADQLAFLFRQGCQQMQGYLFSRPVPATEFTSLLRRPAEPLIIDA